MYLQPVQVTQTNLKLGNGKNLIRHFANRKYIQDGQVALKRSPEFCLKLTYRYL